MTATNTGFVDLLGGLVGYNLGGAIRASYATAQVSKNGEAVRLGGLVGNQSGGAHRNE